MWIVTCSNSAARVGSVGGAPDIVPAGPGGVVPMVAALLRRYGGDWVFVGDGDRTAPPEAVTIDGVTTRLHACPVDPRVAERHHGEISIKVLQWLFHYLHETSDTPLFDGRMWTAWAAYRTVNEQIAGRMTELGGGDPDRLALVNDHQFLLVPAFLRPAVGSRTAAAGSRTAAAWPGPLVYFHQLPWCQSDYFGLLPGPIRTVILDSLLACDVVGFHARRWADAFLQCCARFQPDTVVDGDVVTGRGRRTRVVVAAGPIDEAALERVRADPVTDRWRTELARRAAGRRLLVRAERFDLWKNVRRGLVAYEELLRRRPGTAGEVWFCALLSPPRRPTARHRADQRACEAIAARINERFGRPGRDPVELLYGMPGDNGQHRVVAALEMAAATLVNPTYDGLNLVAMESLLLAPHAPVLLSVNAGAYEALAPYTIGVEPFDVRGTADALATALAGRAPAGSAGRVVPGPRAGNPTGSAEAWLRALLAEAER